MDDTLMMDPPSCSSMRGITARMPSRVPVC